MTEKNPLDDLQYFSLVELSERRAFRIIYPFQSYNDALSMSSFLSLAESRQQLSQKLFKQN